MPIALLRHLIGAAATLTVASANLGAQDSLALRRRAEFDSVVAANRHDVVLDGARVTGGGIDWLVGEAASSHTFLIGEQHLTREITLVEDAILRRLVGIGYTHLAIEVGPYSTRVAERLIRRDSLEAFLSSPGNGLTIPFLFEREFAEMTAAFVRAVPGRGPVLMGLDQEFVYAAPLLSSLVTGAARTAEEREAARAFTDAVRANPSLIGQSDGAALRALRDGFRATRDSSMRRLLDDLLLSHTIYAPFTGRGG
ncbi:MAG: hypothetical protein JNJ98_15350, partial [Gemmatimonadetes bacterium]|nr:hypothetical protein [Gemmatimonadota bacterium]